MASYRGIEKIVAGDIRADVAWLGFERIVDGDKRAGINCAPRPRCGLERIVAGDRQAGVFPDHERP